ncbi:MAG: WbqC family protein [Flexilinea sp.]
MKLAVLQSNYIPWKGYFDIIHDVDLFLFYDEVQYTKNDWRNRNRIYTQTGVEWLTIPVSAGLDSSIDQAKIVKDRWQMKHYQSLLTSYSKAPFFKLYREFLEFVYLESIWDELYLLNRFLIEKVSTEFLKITTKFGDSRSYQSAGSGHEKLLSLVKSTGAESYLSGPAAMHYLKTEDYEKAGIKLRWKDYSGYPEYPQLFRPFEQKVSIFDLLFNTGPDAPYYIWGWREKQSG